MRFEVRPLTVEDGESIAHWSYPGPWSVYDSATAVRADEGYWAVTDENGQLAGFVCLGAEARVPGLEEVSGVLDIGVGMRPDLTGRGLGADLGSAVLAHAQATGAARLRAVVQDWNARSLRVCDRLGFVRAGEHRVADVTYVVLERAVLPVR